MPFGSAAAYRFDRNLMHLNGAEVFKDEPGFDYHRNILKTRPPGARGTVVCQDRLAPHVLGHPRGAILRNRNAASANLWAIRRADLNPSKNASP